MVMEVLNNSAFTPATEVLSQVIECIIEVVITSKKVLVEKQSFAELSSFLQRLIPLLQELRNKNIKSEGLTDVVEILNRQIKAANKLIAECSQRNKLYLLLNCRSIVKHIEDTTREISRALSLIPLASLEISASIKDDINQLCNQMCSAEFRAAKAEEEILEKIESGIQERNVDRSYANNLLVSIAEAVGISTERLELKKEFEEFKMEINSAQLRKDKAEAIQMEQIISLLERADATSSPQEKELKYFAKKSSLGSQLLEPLQSFYCPITREVMVDPVETSSGHTFERSAIEKWFADGNNLCPLTMTCLDTSVLRANKTLRKSIEEWKDRNIMITVASMKARLLSGEVEELIHCLELLQGICEQREIHREWVLLENYIPRVVELLGSRSREIRNRSLVILSILAKDTDDAKERIAKVDNAIESIVHSLGRRIGEGKLAVTLLLELSRSEYVRERIGNIQGCILLLVTMSTGEDSQAARDATELLENISFSDQNVIQMAKANNFKYLLQRLSSGPDDIKMKMAKSLAEMELSDHNKSSLFEHGVLDSLLHMMSQDAREMKKMAVKALQNLSSLPKNGRQMIRQGAVRPLLDLLYDPMSPQTLRGHVAATIMHIAVSTTSQDSSETQVPMFESDEDIYRFFSFINLTGPIVQQNILRAFHAMCQSPSATNIKEKLKQCSPLSVLVHLCESDDHNVRANAVKLLCCMTEDGDDRTVLDELGQKSITNLLRIMNSSSDEEEIISAIGIVSNLPQSSQMIQWLLEAGGLQIIFNFLCGGKKFNGSNNSRFVEKAGGAMRHFTIQTNLESQKRAAEAGTIPVLVRLLDSENSLIKRQAAISLAQFSASSFELSQPIPKRKGFWCFASPPEDGCLVHRGICTVESSFCLLEAGAVEPLVRILGLPDPQASEASLDALLTLIEGERLEGGSMVLDRAKAIPSMIRLLSNPSPRLQEKVLTSLERIFRLVGLKQKYGSLAHIPLVDLTQRGSGGMRSQAARILAQLSVLHEQSSYF